MTAAQRLVGSVPRPEGDAYQDPHLYGLRVEGIPAELLPTIKNGDVAIVSPAAPLIRGHWVIVQGKGDLIQPILYKLLKEPLWSLGPDCTLPGFNCRHVGRHAAKLITASRC
jgi:hypothetical protein